MLLGAALDTVATNVWWILRGFYLGVLVTLLVQFLLLRNLLSPPKDNQPKIETITDESEGAECPEAIRAFLMHACSPSDVSKVANLKLLRLIAPKLETWSMLQGLTITEFKFGDNVPIFHTARIMKQFSSHLECVLELQVTYNGGASFGVEVLVPGGIAIPVVVKILELKGKALLKLPGRDAIHQAISFTEDTVANFDVQSSIFLGEKDILKNAVAKFLKVAVHQMFRDFCVYPAWRDLEQPLISRKPMDPEDFPLLMGVHKESRDGKSVASVWSSGEYTSRPFPPLGLDISSSMSTHSRLTKTSVPDVLEDCTFSVDQQLDPGAGGMLVDLERRLAHTFVRLAKEPSGTTSPESWRSARQKDGITFEKKRVQVPPARGQRSSLVGISEFARSTFHASLPPAAALKILSQPEHFRYAYDLSVTSTDIHSFKSTQRVRTLAFLERKKGSVPKTVTVLELCGKIRLEGTVAPVEDQAEMASPDGLGYIIVYRSVRWTHSGRVSPTTVDSAPIPEDVLDSPAVTPDTSSEVLDVDPTKLFPDLSRRESSASSDEESLNEDVLDESGLASPHLHSDAAFNTAEIEALAFALDPSRSIMAPGTRDSTGSELSVEVPSSMSPMVHAHGLVHAKVAASVPSVGSLDSQMQPLSTANRRSLRATSLVDDGPFSVHLLGYLLEGVPGQPSTTRVTCLSQFSSKALARAEVSFESARAVRDLIQDVNAYITEDTVPGELVKPSTPKPEGSEGTRNVERLKAGIGWTKQKLMTSRTGSWLYSTAASAGRSVRSAGSASPAESGSSSDAPSPTSDQGAAPPQVDKKYETYSEKVISWRQSASFDFVVERDDEMLQLECFLKPNEGVSCGIVLLPRTHAPPWNLLSATPDGLKTIFPTITIMGTDSPMKVQIPLPNLSGSILAISFENSFAGKRTPKSLYHKFNLVPSNSSQQVLEGTIFLSAKSSWHIPMIQTRESTSVLSWDFGTGERNNCILLVAIPDLSHRHANISGGLDVTFGVQFAPAAVNEGSRSHDPHDPLPQLADPATRPNLSAHLLQVIPMVKSNAGKDKSISGSYQGSKRGVYHVCFSNITSVLTGRYIRYRVTLTQNPG
ncbi:hypothetical protein HDU93_006834 [Gonapodya sp. JEL0774]|nr:hypothetical protein HDU93_006834 [Gonapodya sp. JEL0774]